MAVAHGMTSCDDHEAIDKNIYVGHVLCSDGHVTSYEECQKQGKEPVAVVFYTSRETTEDGDGLAIGLREIPAVAFSDTLGVNQGTSTDTDSKCGNANTFALYSNNKAESPLAEEVFSVWRYGQSAYLYPQCSGNASAPCLLGYCQSDDCPLWWSACPQARCRLLVLDKFRSQRTGQCQGLALLPWYRSHAGNAQDREPSCPLHHHFAQITIKTTKIWDGQISLRQSVKGLSD